MSAKNSNFLKVWRMPALLAVFTIIGLLLAIMGTGLWHLLSWATFSVPLYAMFKHGKNYFK